VKVLRFVRSIQDLRGDVFAFAPHDAGDGAVRMSKNFFRGEGRAMAASENKTARQPQFGLLRKIHNFGNISQIVE